MRARTTLLAGALVTAAIALAGCTSTADGTPTPATTSDSDSDPTESTPPSAEQDTNGAPRVTHPLDPAPFLTNPCAALTQTQLTGLQMDKPGVPDTDSAIAKNVGPNCRWQSGLVDSSILVGFTTGNKNGLADLYGARERDAYFEETTVNGYPAIFHDQQDFRSSGDCSIAVGVTDNLAFLATEAGSLDAQGACDRVKQVASAVIDTMKASS